MVPLATNSSTASTWRAGFEQFLNLDSAAEQVIAVETSKPAVAASRATKRKA
jgi:hypothetical protein